MRSEYYRQLEVTADISLDITAWMEWFLGVVLQSMQKADATLDKSLWKDKMWRILDGRITNERQRKVLKKMLDGFEGNLTTSKWAKICSCSQDTATRDIAELMVKEILSKQGIGRGTYYELNV